MKIKSLILKLIFIWFCQKKVSLHSTPGWIFKFCIWPILKAKGWKQLVENLRYRLKKSSISRSLICNDYLKKKLPVVVVVVVAVVLTVVAVVLTVVVVVIPAEKQVIKALVLLIISKYILNRSFFCVQWRILKLSLIHLLIQIQLVGFLNSFLEATQFVQL